MAAFVIGTLFLAIGLLVRKFPNILAGYSRLSQTDKKNAEKNGLPFYASILFSVMGIVTFLGFPLSIWFDQPNLIPGIISLVCIVGLIIAVVGGNFIINNRLR